MPSLLRLALLATLATLHGAAPAAIADVPFLPGIWTNGGGPCGEIYRFYDDGSFSSVQGSKSVTGRYEAERIDGTPAAAKVAWTIASDSGGQDCDGSAASSTGKRVERFVVLGASVLQARLCTAASGQQCGAPLTRDLPAGEYGTETLLNWAERSYPALFPAPASTQWLAPYLYRHYPASGNYVGISGDDVSVLGPVSGWAVQRVGSLIDFRCPVQGCVAAKVTDSVMAGPGMSAAITDGGDLLVWGTSGNMRLPPGVPVAGSPARKVATGVQQVAIGSHSALLLTGDGKVFEWGNWQSSLLLQQESDRLRQVPTDRPAKQVMVEGRTGVYRYPMLLLDDGTPINSGAPPISGLQSLNVGSGTPHAVRADGVAIRLVSDNLGKLAPVEGATDITMIACSGEHCLGLRKDKTVIVWGEDVLLLSVMPDRNQRKTTARPVAGLSNIVKVAAGDGSVYGHSAALTADGKLMLWGDNASLSRPVQLQVAGMEKIVDVHCATHCMARTADGSVWVWGKNPLAMTGSGPAGGTITTPQKVPGIALGAR